MWALPLQSPLLPRSVAQDSEAGESGLGSCCGPGCYTHTRLLTHVS